MLVLVSGVIHDVSSFINDHPGGRMILLGYVGKDATAAFSGGIYKHSNAAHNVSSLFFLMITKSLNIGIQLLAMLRVAVLEGGVERISVYSPAEKLHVTRR